MAAALAALKSCALFKGFTDTGLQIMAGISHARAFPTGTPLFVEGMVGDSLFVVVDGRVRLTAKVGSGEERQLGELGPGEHLGELALVQQGQRMCTATASSAVNVLELRHADFQKLLASKPQACLKLVMSIVGSFSQKVADNKAGLKALLERK